MSTNHPETLRDIATLAHDRHGVGGRAIQRIAEAGGHSLAYTTFDKIYAGTYTSKATSKTLEALAYLAGIPVERVYAAAGKKYPKSKFTDMLPPDVDDLTADQRRAVIEVARAFLKTNKELEGLRHDLEQQNPPEPLRFPSRGDAVDDGAVAGQEDEADWAASKTRGPRDLDVFDAEHGGAGEHDQRNHEDD